MTTTVDVESAWTGAKLLSPPGTQVKGLLPDRSVEAEALLCLTVLCSGESAHEEATHFTEFLEEKLGPKIDLQISHWTVEELEHLRPGVVARELAEGTHLLLLATEEQQELPMRVRKWIASWLNQAQPWYALVCLYGSPDGCECLRNACREARVNFFASSFRAQNTAAPVKARLTPVRADGEQLRGVSHWGINE